MVDFKYWTPKSFLVLRNYSWHQFAADLLAGVTVGLVALPLAMAFAIASGVPPQLGLVLRDHCGISDFGAGRFVHADWRTDRGFRGGGVRNRLEVRD